MYMIFINPFEYSRNYFYSFSDWNCFLFFYWARKDLQKLNSFVIFPNSDKKKTIDCQIVFSPSLTVFLNSIFQKFA